ncbi:MAG TPA: serine--tRNA ligase, partial [Candidatus Polarisedimenticolaceae bacterium]|nr:serine--tRNA ligase [Candidatus Polarisedimenticolaceae bacterium]
VREQYALVAEGLGRRGQAAALEPVRDLDARRRALLVEVEGLKKARNDSSKKIGEVVRAGGDAAAAREEVRRVGERIAQIEGELGTVQSDLQHAVERLPNLPHASVPTGASEQDNVVMRTWGEPPRFAFEPKAHWDLGPALGILDFERAARMAGARFALLLGDGARLERALIQFMLDLHGREHGYLEVEPPFLVNGKALFGTGQLPKFEEDLFKVQPGDYYLIPTAEVPVTNIHAEEILEAAALPLAYCAYTPCFRSEAGSYGKDVRGLIRQHQFDKVELVRFASPATSFDELERLTGHAEEVLRRLALPYRVQALCTADLGHASAKTYDLEVWLPAQGKYREISSCSNFTDYQARRAGIRWRPVPGAKPEPLHTLNGSGLAVGRTLVAVLENYQQEDGTVVIPEVLRPYLQGQERILPRR